MQRSSDFTKQDRKFCKRTLLMQLPARSTPTSMRQRKSFLLGRRGLACWLLWCDTVLPLMRREVWFTHVCKRTKSKVVCNCSTLVKLRVDRVLWKAELYGGHGGMLLP